MLHLDRTITWPHQKLETVSAEKLKNGCVVLMRAPQLGGPYTWHKHAHNAHICYV